MIVRRAESFAVFLWQTATCRFSKTSKSLDLALDAEAGSVRFTSYLDPKACLDYQLTPAEARAYAARILKACDRAESQAPKGNP